jgi:hypothetical protein
MASTAPSGAAATGGGSGGGGSEEQPGDLQRSHLNDVISCVAREIAPFVGYQLNAALYRYDQDSATLMAIFTRHQFQRPGALTVQMVGWDALIAELPYGITASILSDYPAWPVTKYDQLLQILQSLPPSDRVLSYFFLFWIGDGEYPFPTSLNRDDDSMVNLVKRHFAGFAFCKIFEEDPEEETDAYTEKRAAKLVWELVGEATVPPATSGDT